MVLSYHVLPFSTVCVDTASRRFSSCSKVDPSRRFGSGSKVDRSSSLSVTLPPAIRHLRQMLSKSAHIWPFLPIDWSRQGINSHLRGSPSDVWHVWGGLSEFFHAHTFGSILASSPWLLISTSLQLLDLKHILVFYLQRALWATVPSSLLSPISFLRFFQQHLLPWTVVDTSLSSAACHEVESQLVSSSAGLQKVCFWRIRWWIRWTS